MDHPGSADAGLLRLVVTTFSVKNTPRFLRTLAALAATLPAKFVSEPYSRLLHPELAPGPGALKLAAVHLAAHLGICKHPVQCYPDVPSRAELENFIATARVCRRRFGDGQRQYVELGHRGDVGPPMLTLTVPPQGDQWWADWLAQQAGAHDGPTDTPSQGMRVNVQKLLESDIVPADLKDSLQYGFRQPWTGRPPRVRKKNYKSCDEHKAVAGAEFDRFIAHQYIEGPLQYPPWTVSAIACVVKYVPFKARNVVDFTRSDVNPHIARLECDLDRLAEVLPKIQRGSGLFKFDLEDAFYNWPVYVGDADYTGFRHPVTGEYYRYRFLPMGITSSPAVQQSWARVIRDILSREGLRYCRPGSPEANYDYMDIIGKYLDDFLGQLSPELSEWQQCLMFQSCLWVLEDYGFPVKQSKNIWPGSRCDYTGVMIDTVRGTISLTAERCAKWAAALEPVLEKAETQGAVPRGELASVIGKLQWVCEVLPSGQARLSQAYVARDEIIVGPPPGAPPGGSGARAGTPAGNPLKPCDSRRVPYAQCGAKRRRGAAAIRVSQSADGTRTSVRGVTQTPRGVTQTPGGVTRTSPGGGTHTSPHTVTRRCDEWDPDEPCHVHEPARAELRWWYEVLRDGCAVRTDKCRQPSDVTLERPFLWDDIPVATLWDASALPLLPADASMWEELHEVRPSRVPRPGMLQPLVDFEVITSDASGYGGGVWWRHERAHYGFTPEQRRGHLGVSANLRELYMVPWILRRWGPRLRGKRVLFRLDNGASVGAINKGGSAAPAVNALLIAIHRVCQEFGIHLVARHLPGEDNPLADALSRLRTVLDRDDWLLHRRLFLELADCAGPFDVDACADPVGHNAQCEVFWSKIDRCIDHDWARRRIYCNPPFGQILEILEHFWACYQRAPAETSATFVLPVWVTAAWWKLLSGAVIVGHYASGSSLFTRPDWAAATMENPFPSTRVYAGPTEWGVVLIHFPPMLASRSAPSPWDGVPRLSGKPARDDLLLRGLRNGIVRKVRGQAGHGLAGVVHMHDV